MEEINKRKEEKEKQEMIQMEEEKRKKEEKEKKLNELRNKYDLHMEVEKFIKIEDNPGDDEFIRK